MSHAKKPQPELEYRVERVTDGADWLRMPEGVIVLDVGEQGPMLAFFRCPCGCREPVAISFTVRGLPQWAVQDGPDGLTVSPSIWRTKGCRSHFWIRRNKVVWA